MFTSMLNALGKAASASYLANPIFVVGASRSGTSVLLQALGKHPKILSSAGEAPFLTSIGGAVAEFELADSKQYYNESLHCSKAYLYEQLKQLAIETANGEHYGLRYFLKTCVSKRRLIHPQHWAAKTFPTRRGADALQILFPGARFLYIVRNGLEVVQSMTKYSGFKDREFAASCKAWASSIRTFNYLEDYPAAVTLQHEDLTHEPGPFFDRIFDFLGLPKDPSSAAFVQSTIVHPLDRKTEQRTNAKQEFNDRPAPYAGWTAAQKKEFLEICSASMEQLGYDVPIALDAKR